MTIPNNIILSGKPDQYDQGGRYEQTAAANELVAGRIAIKGTADDQWKLGTSGAAGQGVFDKQKYEPGLDGDGKYNENYAQNGKSVDVIKPGDCVMYGCLTDGETIAKGAILQIGAAGKLVALSTGVPVAKAEASSSPSGADDDAFPFKFLEAREA